MVLSLMDGLTIHYMKTCTTLMPCFEPKSIFHAQYLKQLCWEMICHYVLSTYGFFNPSITVVMKNVCWCKSLIRSTSGPLPSAHSIQHLVAIVLRLIKGNGLQLAVGILLKWFCVWMLIIGTSLRRFVQ